jgi:hypothetical protein
MHSGDWWPIMVVNQFQLPPGGRPKIAASSQISSIKQPKRAALLPRCTFCVNPKPVLIVCAKLVGLLFTALCSSLVYHFPPKGAESSSFSFLSPSSRFNVRSCPWPLPNQLLLIGARPADQHWILPATPRCEQSHIVAHCRCKSIIWIKNAAKPSGKLLPARSSAPPPTRAPWYVQLPARADWTPEQRSNGSFITLQASLVWEGQSCGLLACGDQPCP